MNSRGIAFCVTIIAIAATASFPQASAWSNGGFSADENNPDPGTHDWIAEAALALQTRDVSFIKTTYHARFLLGTEAPDNPEYIGDTANHHAYFRSSGAVQDDAAASRARALYDLALDYLRAKDYMAAAYDIGVMAHYISDVGVFGHTMGASTDWGAETHHSDYEDHIDSIIGSLDQPEGALSDSDAYNSTLDLARDVTFGRDVIRANVWMDDNYDWGNPLFVSSALGSVNRSILAVAYSIDHLLAEAQFVPSPQPSAPSPPVSLAASQTTPGTVTLSWSPPPDDGGSSITGYTVYRSSDPSNPAEIGSVGAMTTTFLDTKPPAGEVYYWVAAENSVGSSELSGWAHTSIAHHSNSLLLPAVLSAILAALASGGALAWRSRSRRRAR